MTTASQGRTRRVLANANYVGYTSTAAPISISLNVTPVGGSTSNYTGSCTAVSTGTSGTCTVTGFTAAPGPTTIAGTVTESGNTIASFSNLTIIQPSTVNSINFTANPVVASVAVVLSAPTTYLNTTLSQTLPAVHAGTAYDVPLAINAYDANGKVIAGTKSYVDSTGTPISLILSVKNSQAGGRGTVSIKGPPRVTAPGQAAIYAHYDGNWLNYSTISVTSTSSVIASLSGATLTTSPQVTNEYTIPTSNSYPTTMTAGPDGNLWFTEYNTNKVGRITPSGAITEYSIPTVASEPYGIVKGPDGNLWFTEYNTNKVGRITTSGSVSEFSIPTSGSGPQSIAVGADGNLWFIENGANKVSRITTQGSVIEFTIPTANAGAGSSITEGSDGNIWFTEDNVNRLGKITTAGAITEYPINCCGLSGVTAGSDGNLWVSADGNIQRVTTSGANTYFSAGGNQSGITLGIDNNYWTAELFNNNIVRMTPSGVFSEFPIPTAGAYPASIIVGADGDIWFTEDHVNKIGKLVL